MKFLISLVASAVTIFTYAQGVGINTDGTTPDNNTILDIKSEGANSSYYGLKVKNSSGTDQFIVRSDGRVGVGTTAPSHSLHIDNTSADDCIRLEGPNSYGSGARINFGDGDYVYLDEDSDDDFTIYASDRVAIMCDELGVNTTTPAYDFDVNGYARIRQDLYINTEKRIYPTPGGSYARLGSSGNSFQDLYSRYTYFSTTYTPSDSTLKKDITPIPQRIDAIEVIKNLQPKAFKWKLDKLYWEGAEPVCAADTSWRYGFIAQEVQQYLPETTQIEPESGRLMMNYESIVSVLFQATKEQQKRIEELEKQLATR